ncbi:MAG TPA: BTAD domain-containing putative transcriptional regulator [Gaiellaceae bacterium]|nr:BTAD domain-containing putative transcriptional regulator [Gaiellaceae bacterium]
MDVHVLGPFEVLSRGRPVEIGRGKERALLALLALRAGDVVSVDRIVDALWGEAPPPSAVNSVHVYVSKLRKALGDEAILTRGTGYALELDPDALDSARFERLLERGRAELEEGDAEAAAEALRAALALWRGPGLQDFAYEAFAQTEISRLEELRLLATETRVEADLQLGRHAQVVPELERLVSEHPLRERLRGLLMLALYRCGRQADALAVYHDARATLRDELGLEPGSELRALEQRILQQDPALDPPARPLPRLLTRRAGGSLIAVGAALLLGATVAFAVTQLAEADEAVRRVTVQPNAVLAFDRRTARVSAEIAVGERPSSLAVGEGFVWVLNGDDRTVSRIDPGRGHAVRTFAGHGTPTDVAAGAGAAWIATAENVLLRVDPRTARVVQTLALPRPRFGSREGEQAVVGSDTRYVAVGAGSVWVGAYERGSIWRIDPGRGAVQATIHADAGAIAVGRRAVWVTGYLGVTEIDPVSSTVREVIPLALGEPNVAAAGDVVAVAAGPVWLISPTRHALSTSLETGTNASAVALDGGVAWVASALDRALTRVELASGRVLERIELARPPTDVVVGLDRVWVAVA